MVTLAQLIVAAAEFSFKGRRPCEGESGHHIAPSSRFIEWQRHLCERTEWLYFMESLLLVGALLIPSPARMV